MQAAANLIRSSDYLTHKRRITTTYILPNQDYRESNGGDLIDAIDASIAANAAEAARGTVSAVIIGPDLWQHPVRRKLSAFNLFLWAKTYTGKRDAGPGRNGRITKQLNSTIRCAQASMVAIQTVLRFITIG